MSSIDHSVWSHCVQYCGLNSSSGRRVIVEASASHVLLLFIERSWLWLVFMFVMEEKRFRGGILYGKRGT